MGKHPKCLIYCFYACFVIDARYLGSIQRKRRLYGSVRGAISDDRPYRDTQAGGRRARTSRVISSTNNLCGGFRPGLDRGTERDGFTQSGASMLDARARKRMMVISPIDHSAR
jgi:hypothetical protein